VTSPVDPDDATNDGASIDRAVRRGPTSRGLWIVVGVLAATSLLLASRDQLPAPPVLVVVIGAIGIGLWRLADRGGRRAAGPITAPLEALVLIAAVVGAIVVFWAVFGWLE